MKFHVTFTVRDTFDLDQVEEVQNRIGQTVQKLMQTGKVTESGVMIGDRHGFFVIEASSAEELFTWLAPFYDVAKPTVEPIVPFDLLPKLFGDLQALHKK